MIRRPRRRCLFAFFVMVLPALMSCVHMLDRQHQADSIARDGGLSPLTVPAPPFTLKGYARISRPREPIVVYIEGDGLAWISRNTTSPDPTPTDPIGLRLAALDSAPNVVYLARPCQYLDLEKPLCRSRKYWTSHRFAPEVISAYNQAFQFLSSMGGGGFHLVGFSGGAAVATLAAAHRTDVLTLRSVAGNLDHVLLNRLHEVSPMPQSLNPADVASQLTNTPQLHFVGEQDNVVGPSIFQSYRRSAGDDRCIGSQTVPKASHNAGWSDVWPRLATISPHCRGGSPKP
ncbi:alpha/beta hydrolase [Magnetospirillum sp. SS-4]|uniref:alpha/beta hydrolase n=1 Tax=Magnetospirillum sp. SS-4 TaxID=2681465 RepID=UPI00137FC35B|nr:alpha/beta hydrolase [Magnetospirillum sp. SS-4]CAA7624565.1 Esterase/lipase/thioesterase protein [Magnetospirillum sp. SS-4]